MLKTYVVLTAQEARDTVLNEQNENRMQLFFQWLNNSINENKLYGNYRGNLEEEDIQYLTSLGYRIWKLDDNIYKFSWE